MLLLGETKRDENPNQARKSADLCNNGPFMPQRFDLKNLHFLSMSVANCDHDLTWRLDTVIISCLKVLQAIQQASDIHIEQHGNKSVCKPLINLYIKQAKSVEGVRDNCADRIKYSFDGADADKRDEFK